MTDEYLSMEPLAIRKRTHTQHSEVEDDIDQNVLTALRLTGDESVLDVGCGTGSFLRRLVAVGHRGRLVGLDKSDAAVTALADLPLVSVEIGDAVSLPFRSGEFQIVLARHMLYHVADLATALSEADRVLHADGRFTAVVNHPEVTPQVVSLVRDAVRACGMQPPEDNVNWVHSDNLGSWLSTHFPIVTPLRHDNALVFSEPEPLVRFACALTNFYGVPPTSPDKRRVFEVIANMAHAWFDENIGPWRDPKGYTVFIATRH